MTRRFEGDQRNALFSTFGNKSARDSADDYYRSQNLEEMEADNDNTIVDLEAKVQEMKEVTLGIRDETRESHSVLSGLGVDFDDVQGMVGATLKKMTNLMSSKSGRHMWYLMFFVVFMFVLMYVLYKR
eukprot:GHVU01214015.1.p2 GENE.GHVU01214015.1~~GHVU01214015.1.p2  ORF type:complete len:128 (+),score=17.45 GHVU01214015.1:81-464(+)